MSWAPTKPPHSAAACRTATLRSQPRSSARNVAVPAIGRAGGRAFPIGVPQVPYRNSRDGMWQWIDIWNCLYRDRIIFLYQAIDEELGNQLVATMLYLDSENNKDISLYINGTGGQVVPILSMHDTMRHIKSDVATVGFGGCMGMMGFVLAMGQKGKVRHCERARAKKAACFAADSFTYQFGPHLYRQDPAFPIPALAEMVKCLNAALLPAKHARDASPPLRIGARPGLGYPQGVSGAPPPEGLHHCAPGSSDWQRL